jgi:tryptophan synthase alpha chain
MKNRLTDLLNNYPQKLLSVFYTAGFPLLEDTGVIAAALEKAGVDFIEIGIPFSDPVADGPVIQESNKIALDNGMNLKILLRQVKEIRKSVKIPIILMGYINPVLQYGVERFCKDASEAGVDGLILPDLPLDEYQDKYKSIVEFYGLCNTFLISPTTSEERIRKIDESTNGFIYAVSSNSITGAKAGFGDQQLAYFKRIRAMELKNPFLIGFGISNHATFSRACEYGAGAIVGSSFINLLNQRGNIEQFVREMKGL